RRRARAGRSSNRRGPTDPTSAPQTCTSRARIPPQHSSTRDTAGAARWRRWAAEVGYLWAQPQRSEDRRGGKDGESGRTRGQAEDGIRGFHVTGVLTCALPISSARTGRQVLESPSSHGSDLRTANVHVTSTDTPATLVDT